MKKLLSLILAEFRTVNANMYLSDEEYQTYLKRNYAKDLSQAILSNPQQLKDEATKNNFQLIGQNADDLRTFIIHNFQVMRADGEQK